MLITPKNIVEFWASEPKWEPTKDDVICIGMIPFSDLGHLSPREKEILRPVLTAHH
jgi:hypothetical protein